MDRNNPDDEGKPDFQDSGEFMTIDQRETMRELNDSRNQLVGAPVPPPLLLLPPPPPASISTSLDVDMADAQVPAAGKRKRGRPTRGQGKTGPSPPPPQTKPAAVDEEEDVCFICFDGGSLVLCDRRGCPKAYHPTCIKRDESFFRSKAKWNCGWHICSSCQKASYYMCYTCTYSLCKGCTKDADYVCVRGNKGFCGTCMKTIMLIENVKMDNVEPVQVDFDDITSWEYLFKVYWVYLKEKQSLTVDELTNAKNRWKGDELPKARTSWKRNGFTARKEILSGEQFHANNEKVSCSDNCNGNGEGTLSKRRKTSDQSDQVEKNSLVTTKSTIEKAKPLPEGATWATKALLEFIAHMKDGDQSMISPSDVQALLLEYIKRNNLRDPGQKAEVVCDARLTNLFRRPRIGHLEMLKLLEYHFLTKEKSSLDNTVRTAVVDAHGRQLEEAGRSDGQSAMADDKQHKNNKNMDETESPIDPNADEYATIDAHNINLLYLKSSLMEKLLDDAKNFHEKVVGSFVRVKIATGDRKQDLYRLVRVVGTCKADESYKVGSRTIDMKLEVLNLDKKEIISINEISDHEFSEDECRRLRETIKCGLIKPLKVGEIKEKATILQPIKASDSLEAELLRLNNLRDRASEKGHKKELRECLEKIELLKSPKERERRLLEIPIVHMDRKKDQSYVSEEDAEDRDGNKQGDNLRQDNTSVPRKGIELNSSPGDSDLNDIGHRALKTLAAASEQVEMNSRVDLEATPQEQRNDSETEKLWHYQDPSGKIQGPFSMAQLRIWSDTKIFPDSFRVWKINEKQQDSILLTAALTNPFPIEPPQNHISPQETTVLDKDIVEKPEENKRGDHDPKPLQNEAQILELPESSKSGSTGQFQGSSNPSIVDMDSLNTASKANDVKTNVDKRAESDGHSSQSSVETWRPQSMNSSTNGWDPNSSFLSMLTSIEKSEQDQKFDLSNLSSTVPIQPNENNSGPPSWSTTASSLVIGGRQVPEVAVDWLSFSSGPVARSVEPWDINLVSPSSLKVTGPDLLTLSSSTQTIGGPGWNPMVPEPTEFCSLVDESVSDLLAEVEAMESLRGLPSPTSKLRYDLELTPGSDDDCFSPVERLDLGRSDALSSTSDIQIPSQLSVVEESLRLSLMPSQPAMINQPLAVSQMPPQPQLAVIDNKPPHFAHIQQPGIMQNEFSVNQSQRIDRQNLDMNRGELPQGNSNGLWGPSHGLVQQQNSAVSTGNQGRHGSERGHSGQRDHRNHSHSRESGSGRDRSSWNRQVAGYGGSGNGGGSLRGPGKGQRVCKFYESGHCKRGASCSYWHP